MPFHEDYMRRAIEIARRNAPKRPFGAVLVDTVTEQIVAEGWNRIERGPLWHGEMDAIDRLSQQHRSVDWPKLRLYTTAEPCPMCQGAILWAGIGGVVFGTSIGYLQQKGWRQIDVAAAELTRRAPFARCQIIGGVLADACNQLFDRSSAAGSWPPDGNRQKN